MRQAGILAAAGIYALEHHVDRLADDHAHAKLVAQALDKTGWARVVLTDVETNIIFFSVAETSGKNVVSVLESHGVLCSGDGNTIRLVTNLDLSSEDITEVCRRIEMLDPKEFIQ